MPFTKGLESFADVRPQACKLGGLREGGGFLPETHPFLHAAGQVLGGHPEQLYRSRLLSGTLPREGFCPSPCTTSLSARGPLPEPRDSPPLWPSNPLEPSGHPFHMVHMSLPCWTNASPPNFLVQPPRRPPKDSFLCRPRGHLQGNMAEPQMALRALSLPQEMLRCIWGHFLRVIQGTSPTLSHSSSLLHSLGSVTVRAAPGGACCPGTSVAPGGLERPAPVPIPVSPCRSSAVWTNKGSCRGQTPARRPCCSSAGRWNPRTAATRTSRMTCPPTPSATPRSRRRCDGSRGGRGAGEAGREREGSAIRICF